MSSQFVTTSLDKRPNSALPFVFTEQGVTQLSAVLRSDVAVEMSIRINDAFHAMRHFLVANAGLFQRLSGISAWRKREGYGQGPVRHRSSGIFSGDGAGVFKWSEVKIKVTIDILCTNSLHIPLPISPTLHR